MKTDIRRLMDEAAALRAAGDTERAIAAYRRLLAIAPDLPNSWYNLAWLLRRNREFTAALEAYQQALVHRVAEPEEVHLNRSVIFSDDLALPDAAEQSLRQALQLNPRYTPALLNLGNLHEDRGEFQAAQAAYERVLANDPQNPTAWARLAGVKTVQNANDPLLVHMRRMLVEPRLKPGDKAMLGFALAKLLDGCAAYDEAFEACAQANRDSSAAMPDARYDRVARDAHIADIVAAFPLPLQPRQTGASEPAQTPIFICGMFRSGSTLAEQILASHSAVVAGGELDWIPHLMRQHAHPFPAGFSKLTAETQAVLAATYRKALATRCPSHQTMTDKRPDNYLYVGVIKSLFPNARIVLTQRHPLDNCLSVHFLHLAQSKPYALSLSDTAHYYRGCRQLMAHWQRLYGPDVYVFDYDKFVGSPREGTEALLRFCGLPVEEACLRFHENRNAVRTASATQVRQPTYTHASGRWKHYEKHLSSISAALSDMVD